MVMIARRLKRVVVGQVIKCKYPLRGNRNILCNRCGKVIAKGEGPNGPYIKLKCFDGGYRTMLRSRMVDAELLRNPSSV